MPPAKTGCVFCGLIASPAATHWVLQEDGVVAFLDKSPLFRGHVLVVPTKHVVTLADLPTDELAGFFGAVQRLTVAVRDALDAEGTFVANNNVVSQSVPHLHFHVIPRRKGDGLRGFFWPRQKYATDDDAADHAAKIRAVLAPHDDVAGR